MPREKQNAGRSKSKSAKSTDLALKSRGLATEAEMAALSDLSLQERLALLGHNTPSIRTAAAASLEEYADEAAGVLLRQLSCEKCLYTRIAICNCLEKGGPETARQMVSCLGTIGNNQHRRLPDKVSAKKSFPLPRDIIARSLGKMDPSIFPVLLETLESGSPAQISEVLDAIGYMVFYHPALSGEENCSRICSLTLSYRENEVIVWKLLMCLSAFPTGESIRILTEYGKEPSILGSEARRSLALLEGKKQNSSHHGQTVKKKALPE